MKALVTGANGMLGRDLCPILKERGFEVFASDIDNMDITCEAAVKEVFMRERPDIVFHCAAYTNVDKAETDITTARLINGTGTENIARSAAEINAAVVYISTDYVFNGNGTSPYTPDMPAEPLNNYGITKFEGEEAVRKYCQKYYIARTSWLYGLHGKNFVETMLSLADAPEIKVVDDQVGCPTWTVELCNGILQLIDKQQFGTYHVCGSGKTSWYGFAAEIFRSANLKVNLNPCTSNEFIRPAKRPAYSVMANNGICRDWHEALHDYMNLRKE